MPASAKICGISTAPSLDAALRCGASHIGFVAFPPSPRHVTFDAMAGLAARVPAQVGRVAVLVDPDDAAVDRALAAGTGTLQLHRTTAARAANLRARTGAEIWIAIAVRTRADLEVARAYEGAADRLLYDAKTPEGAALPGGMGLRFDWSLLDGFAHPLPWVLSGGLDAANVGTAIARTGAAMVDVSSGVESAPGIKDVDRIAAFLKAIPR